MASWVDRQREALEEKERRAALLATLTPAHRHAFELLVSKGVSVEEIVRVDPDAILFRGPKGARTAWLRGSIGLAVKVCVEEGFPCEPGPNVLTVFGS